jgi:hypothetical protein
MKIARRIVGALMAAALTFGVVATASPAEARKDTSWGQFSGTP